MALERAMQVNSAYKALKDPIARAELLARRRGITLDDVPAPSMEFLEATMERREALSAAVARADRARIEELAQGGKAEQADHYARLSELLSPPGPVSDGAGAGLAALLGEVLTELRYLRRFVESAEAELEAGES